MKQSQGGLFKSWHLKGKRGCLIFCVVGLAISFLSYKILQVLLKVTAERLLIPFALAVCLFMAILANMRIQRGDQVRVFGLQVINLPLYRFPSKKYLSLNGLPPS